MSEKGKRRGGCAKKATRGRACEEDGIVEKGGEAFIRRLGHSRPRGEPTREGENKKNVMIKCPKIMREEGISKPKG